MRLKNWLYLGMFAVAATAATSSAKALEEGDTGSPI